MKSSSPSFPRRTVLKGGAALLLTGCGLRGGASTSVGGGDPYINDDAHALAARVRDREVTARELLDLVIARIEGLEGELNAMTTRCFERARDRALRGVGSGPFAGVPFLIKDMIDCAGVRRTDGANAFFTRTPTRSPALMMALENAGLNVVGVTNVPEFATLPTTVNERFGATLNPWDVTRTPAGSSGGSAVSVAAGYVPLAHATDGAGSIRLPASYCGVFGFKPSRHRTVSGEADGKHDLIKHHHAISRSVRDSAGVLAITEDRSSTARYASVGFVRREREGGALRRPLRVGLDLNGLAAIGNDEDVLAAMASTVGLLEGLGHEVIEMPRIPLDPTQTWERVEDVFLSRLPPMIGMIEGATGKDYRDVGVLSPFALSFAATAEGRDAKAMLSESVAYFERCEQVWESWASGVDVVLSPVQPTGPPPVDLFSVESSWEAESESMRAFMNFTAMANITGAPAMSVPLHWTEEGWPIGSQFMALPGRDRELLELAYQLESARPWRGRWAPISVARLRT